MSVVKENFKLRDDGVTAAEKCSLLVDGELDDVQLEAFLAQIYKDESLIDEWTTFQVIGDVLRSNDLAQSHVMLCQSNSLNKFRERLAKEPLIMAPNRNRLTKNKSNGLRVLRMHWPQWAGLAAASSFAVLVVVGVVGGNSEDSIGRFEPSSIVATAPSDIAYGKSSRSIQNNQSIAPQLESAIKNYINDQSPVRTAMMGNGRGINGLSKPREVMQQNPKEFAPYMSAHQQFGYGSTLSDNYAVHTSAK